MNKTQILKKLKAYKANPEVFAPLTPSELADLVIVVLGQVSQIEKAIVEKKLDLDSRIGKESDTLVKQTKSDLEAIKRQFTEQIREQIVKGAQTLTESSTELEKRVAQAIATLRNGEDGIVSDAEIERAAEIAHSLIELPDFEKLVQTEITASPKSIRDSLELLQGDERLEQTAVKNLTDDLQKLWDAIQNVPRGSGGTIGKNQVYNFIQQAVADGTIPSGGSISDGDKGDITVSNSGATWTIDNDTIGLDELSATGTPDNTKFLRGDNTWATPVGSGSGISEELAIAYAVSL